MPLDLGTPFEDLVQHVWLDLLAPKSPPRVLALANILPKVILTMLPVTTNHRRPSQSSCFPVRSNLLMANHLPHNSTDINEIYFLVQTRQAPTILHPFKHVVSLATDH